MSSSNSSRPLRPARSPESFESQRLRDSAVEILRSYEKLSWISFQRCESMAQTRLYYQKIVAGFDPKDESDVYWQEDFTPHPPKEGEKSGSSRKGKGRASLGRDGAASSSKRQREETSGNATPEKAADDIEMTRD